MAEHPVPLSKQSWSADSTPYVSICCTTYNHEKYIRDCLESFLMQETTFPVEILIHDDASTDATAEIVKAYQAKYPLVIKPICQDENQYSKGVKPNVAFNYPRACGKYIAVCEGDDFWTDPRKLETQVAFLEGNPGYVLCYHDARIIDENGRLVSESKLPDKCKTDFSAEELQKGAWTLTLTRCFRNVIKEFPPEIGNVKNVDIFLTALLGEHGGGKYMPQISPAVYRAQSGSIWSSLKPQTQIQENLNTFLYLYLYHTRQKRTELAVQILFEQAFPFFADFRPETNPYREKIEIFAKREQRAWNAHDIMENSPEYKLGRIMLRPFRFLKSLLNGKPGNP